MVQLKTGIRQGLVYVHDSQPGFCRRKQGRGFSYLDEKNKHLKDKSLLKRLKALKIPPAWKDVWICKLENGYIQATGYDEKGRKQYIYHPDWIVLSQHEKFKKLLDFGHALPVIREKTDKNLQHTTWDREKVLSLVLRFMDEKHVRVGNKHYEEENQTYGVTTLRRKHLKEKNGSLILEYKAKSGKYRKLNIEDPSLKKLVKESSELPGYEIFRYFDHDGKSRAVDSTDVNEFLQELTGEEFTSKTFRTWAGTVLAVQEYENAKTEAEKDKRISLKTTIVKKVAKKLGNTIAVAEKYYIHPVILQTLSEEKFKLKIPGKKGFSNKQMKYLEDEERLIFKMLEEKPEIAKL
ncbi:MAG: DNA topoisomerase IB [Bacteroidales bacterium]|nr:DNA topoisomerase IB [Bacteroidales bacterium]